MCPYRGQPYEEEKERGEGKENVDSDSYFTPSPSSFLPPLVKKERGAELGRNPK